MRHEMEKSVRDFLGQLLKTDRVKLYSKRRDLAMATILRTTRLMVSGEVDDHSRTLRTYRLEGGTS